MNREGPESLNIPPKATLLRVYLNASDRLHGKAVYRILVETAREMHIAGASVFLVDFSYGTHRQLHDAKSDYLSFHIPVVVEIVDASDRIEELLGNARADDRRRSRRHPSRAIDTLCGLVATGQERFSDRDGRGVGGGTTA